VYLEKFIRVKEKILKSFEQNTNEHAKFKAKFIDFEKKLL